MRIAVDADDDPGCKLYEAVWEIERRILDTPAQGFAGLAVKLGIAFHDATHTDPVIESALAYGAPITDEMLAETDAAVGALWSAVRDAERLAGSV